MKVNLYLTHPRARAMSSADPGKAFTSVEKQRRLNVASRFFYMHVVNDATSALDSSNHAPSKYPL